MIGCMSTLDRILIIQSQCPWIHITSLTICLVMYLSLNLVYLLQFKLKFFFFEKKFKLKLISYIFIAYNHLGLDSHLKYYIDLRIKLLFFFEKKIISVYLSYKKN